jgi:hypothetical protein
MKIIKLVATIRHNAKQTVASLCWLSKAKPAGCVPPDAILFIQAAIKSMQKVPFPCGGHFFCQIPDPFTESVA